MKIWVVVNIGCLECGRPTDIESVFLTEAEARWRRELLLGPRSQMIWTTAGGVKR